MTLRKDCEALAADGTAAPVGVPSTPAPVLSTAFVRSRNLVALLMRTLLTLRAVSVALLG